MGLEQWLGRGTSGLILFWDNKVCTLNKEFVHNSHLE